MDRPGFRIFEFWVIQQPPEKSTRLTSEQASVDQAIVELCLAYHCTEDQIFTAVSLGYAKTGGAVTEGERPILRRDVANAMQRARAINDGPPPFAARQVNENRPAPPPESIAELARMTDHFQREYDAVCKRLGYNPFTGEWATREIVPPAV